MPADEFQATAPASFRENAATPHQVCGRPCAPTCVLVPSGPSATSPDFAGTCASSAAPWLF